MTYHLLFKPLNIRPSYHLEVHHTFLHDGKTYMTMTMPQLISNQTLSNQGSFKKSRNANNCFVRPHLSKLRFLKVIFFPALPLLYLAMLARMNSTLNKESFCSYNAPVKLFCPHPLGQRWGPRKNVYDKKGHALEKRVIRVFR